MAKKQLTFNEQVIKAIANIKEALGNIDLSSLTTEDKTTIINAINEIESRISTLESRNFTPTFEELQTAGLIGTNNNQLAVGDHDHEIGDMSVYFDNKLI